MAVVVSQLVVDCAEPAALARWWAEVLGWEVVHDPDEEPDVAIVPPEGAGAWLFQRVPEPKSVKNRLHVDVRPQNGSSQAEELERLVDLGARPVDIGQGDVTWHVLADPEGNEFCLLRSTPAELEALLARRAASD